MSSHIIKSDGYIEDFNSQKLLNSLIKSGASKKQAESAIAYIETRVQEGMSTEDIHQMAMEYLSGVEHKLALKYSLKRAIMNMGPQGYIFEQYISKILSRYGYQTEVGQILKGCCVDHEVDVVAKKDNLVFLIECKYHNYRGTYSDVKTALYVHARFIDIEKASKKIAGDNNRYHGWLVTNTKCTSDAIKYASCVKLKIIAWQYPSKRNLQYYIDEKRLYPVSILTLIKKKQQETLFNSGIILVQELEAIGLENIMQTLSVDRDAALKIINEIKLLLD
jgi:Holliday junction resolvase